MGRVDKMYCSSLCANREHFYQKLYGIGGLEFRNLLEQQGGVCALCRQDMGTGRGRHIDHDHLTGKVRGILCKSCNTALGAFGDDPGRLRRAARYIEQGGVHASEIAIRMRAFEVQQRSRDANR